MVRFFYISSSWFLPIFERIPFLWFLCLSFWCLYVLGFVRRFYLIYILKYMVRFFYISSSSFLLVSERIPFLWFLCLSFWCLCFLSFIRRFYLICTLKYILLKYIYCVFLGLMSYGLCFVLSNVFNLQKSSLQKISRGISFYRVHEALQKNNLQKISRFFVIFICWMDVLLSD